MEINGLVGNALTDDFYDYVGKFEFMWSAGLISDETYKLLNLFCDSQSWIHFSKQCGDSLDIVSEELGNIDIYSIFTPSCTASDSSSNQPLKRLLNVGGIGEKYDPCILKHAAVYFNLPEVQKALHVYPDPAPSKWETCSDVVNSNWKDSATSVLDIYCELIQSGLRIWMFSGDTDTVVPVTSTRVQYRRSQTSDCETLACLVGGWTQEYSGLTFVTVRGAGHKIPLQRPKQALTLFKAFLSGSPMPTLRGVSES
ncbi:hypothetical protein HHK36_013782 [Tetracentron sinense]|uniref:Serine carboxypeptidase n=1 Tax=Tetracentron sinense TaxID=13715 RepID=A0A834Z3Z5_TETSI|nr:hypothetical protein HHK36_013782 [Tetracentron sinense]